MVDETSYAGFMKRIKEIMECYDLKDYHAFIFWFAQTVLGYDDRKILDSMCDGTHDKGVDAVLIDAEERRVMIIQSKYERDGNTIQAKENDIKLLAVVKNYLNSKSSLDTILFNANSVAKRLINEAYEKTKKDSYSLELVFISTHKRIPNADSLLKNTLGLKKGEYNLYFFDEIMLKYDDSLRDFTPDIGYYNLKFFDPDKTIIKIQKNAPFNSWVLSVPLEDMKMMVNKYKNQLFRKNVRNFLGKSICNKGIIDTLSKEQDNFWYYNNGITILADEASIVMEEGYIRLKNPQVVNGCQTVRSIEYYNGELTGNLLVRIIESKNHDFITRLTLYQNTSNPVSNRDLKSNEPVQIRLKHQFAYKKIYYEIKRGEDFIKLKKEYPSYKSLYDDFINNENAAKNLATVKLGPHVSSSKGSNYFFGEGYDEIFTDTTSTTEILALKYLSEDIFEEYTGKKNFYEYSNHWMFKGRAIYLMIKFVYDALRNVNEWEARYVKFNDIASETDYEKFRSVFEKIVEKYFELVYKSYKKSGEQYHNTFLQAKETYETINKENADSALDLQKQLYELFSATLV